MRVIDLFVVGRRSVEVEGLREGWVEGVWL